ncbi:MAG: thiamine phosphate synthase [Polyangiaceae bacterium]|nr:thiamine phosphate synthase [Polyangiaceae bacterium]
MAITDTGLAPAPLLVERMERLCALAQEGTVLVQLRDVALDARARLALGAELREITRRSGQLLAVNDRLDLARLLDADAVHLGERSFATEDARRLVGGVAVVRACHDPDRVGVRDAEAVVLSPVCEPRKGAPALGIEGLRRAAAGLRRVAPTRRLYALGGVDETSAARCLEAGAHGVACLGAVLDGRHPRALLRALDIDRPLSRGEHPRLEPQS